MTRGLWRLSGTYRGIHHVDGLLVVGPIQALHHRCLICPQCFGASSGQQSYVFVPFPGAPISALREARESEELGTAKRRVFQWEEP